MNYQDVCARLGKSNGTKLRPVFDSNSPDFGLPQDYELFLQQVGAGVVGNAIFQFYDGVVFADEIYGSPTEECENILIFWDDYQGTTFGFDRHDWSIVSIDSNQGITRVADSFEQFIAEQFP